MNIYLTKTIHQSTIFELFSIKEGFKKKKIVKLGLFSLGGIVVLGAKPVIKSVLQCF